MNFEIQFTDDGVVPGNYSAEFIGAREKELKHGSTVILEWRIVEDNCEGERVSCLCGKQPQRRSKLAKFARALNGGKIRAGDLVRFDDFLGVRGTVEVEQKNDYPNVVGFKRDKVQPEPEPDPFHPADEEVYF